MAQARRAAVVLGLPQKTDRRVSQSFEACDFFNLLTSEGVAIRQARVYGAVKAERNAFPRRSARARTSRFALADRRSRLFPAPSNAARRVAKVPVPSNPKPWPSVSRGDAFVPNGLETTPHGPDSGATVSGPSTPPANTGRKPGGRRLPPAGTDGTPRRSRTCQ